MRIYFFSILYRSVKSQGEFMIQNQYFPEIIDTYKLHENYQFV